MKPLLSLLRNLLRTLGRESGGVYLMATFFRLRVQLLRARPHPMWAVEGVSDQPLDDEEVETKVRGITSLRAADPCNVKCPVAAYGGANPVPEVSFCIVLFVAGFLDLLFLDSTLLCLLQGRSLLDSRPPLLENGPHDESKFVEEEDDDEDIPSAISPNEEVEDDDDEGEPARKRQKRRSGGDSATASSPAKDVDADLEAGMSSAGVRSQDDWDEPLAAPPVSSAPSRGFARMPSVSLGSYDGDKAAR